jgi:hypothetical protein
VEVVGGSDLIERADTVVDGPGGRDAAFDHKIPLHADRAIIAQVHTRPSDRVVENGLAFFEARSPSAIVSHEGIASTSAAVRKQDPGLRALPRTRAESVRLSVDDVLVHCAAAQAHLEASELLV